MLTCTMVLAIAVTGDAKEGRGGDGLENFSCGEVYLERILKYSRNSVAEVIGGGFGGLGEVHA